MAKNINDEVLPLPQLPENVSEPLNNALVLLGQQEEVIIDNPKVQVPKFKGLPLVEQKAGFFQDLKSKIQSGEVAIKAPEGQKQQVAGVQPEAEPIPGPVNKPRKDALDAIIEDTKYPVLYASNKRLSPTIAGSENFPQYEIRPAILTERSYASVKTRNADFVVPEIPAEAASAAQIKAEAAKGRHELNDGKKGDERLALEAIAREYGITAKDSRGHVMDAAQSYTFRGADTRALTKAEADFKNSPGTEKDKDALKSAFTKAVDNAEKTATVSGDAKDNLMKALANAKVRDGMGNDHDQAKAIGRSLEQLKIIDDGTKTSYHGIASDNNHVKFNVTKGVEKLEQLAKEALKDGVISDAEKLKLVNAYEGVVKPGLGVAPVLAQNGIGKN